MFKKAPKMLERVQPRIKASTRGLVAVVTPCDTFPFSRSVSHRDVWHNIIAECGSPKEWATMPDDEVLRVLQLLPKHADTMKAAAVHWRHRAQYCFKRTKTCARAHILFSEKVKGAQKNRVADSMLRDWATRYLVPCGPFTFDAEPIAPSAASSGNNAREQKKEEEPYEGLDKQEEVPEAAGCVGSNATTTRMDDPNGDAVPSPAKREEDFDKTPSKQPVVQDPPT